jgi:hypothetical protein
VRATRRERAQLGLGGGAVGLGVSPARGGAAAGMTGGPRLSVATARKRGLAG